MTELDEIEEAKQVLAKNGYFVAIMFTVDDVQNNYDCTDEEAFKVLEKVFQNKYVDQEISDAVKIIADSMNLKHKE